MLADLQRSFEHGRAEGEFIKLARQHPLRYLFLEITRRCNLACVYCGSECSPASVRPELSSSEWIQVLREIAEDFVAEQVVLAITGGEPLLKPGFFDIITAADSLGFPFGMVSNGSLLDLNTARRLTSSRIGAISLSLDGPSDLHDSLRGSGSAAKARHAVSNLREAGYAGRLEIISTIVRPTVPRLRELRKHIADMRVAEWRLVPVIPIGRAARDLALIPDAEDIRKVLEFVIEGRADGYLPRPEFGDECYLGAPYEGAVRPYQFLCRAGLTVGGVLCDGRIGACPELPDCFVQGDVRVERFSEVWENRYQNLRDRAWTLRGACAECDCYDACRGGSLHLYRDLGQGPLRCIYEMLGECGS